MTKEALKLALEALENHCGNYKLDDAGCERWDKAVTAINEALAQPAQEPVGGCACRWDSEGDRVVTCDRHEGWLEVIAEWADRARDAEKKLKAPAQPVQEPHNFCPRCGKRAPDPTTIHTCTPPKGGC